VTIRVDRATLEYFKHLAAELDVPYQTLINSYLRDCATAGVGPPRPGGACRRQQIRNW
jgi:hypothetical protein